MHLLQHVPMMFIALERFCLSLSRASWALLLVMTPLERIGWQAVGTLRHIVPDDKKLIINIVDSSSILDEHLLVEAWVVAFIAKACLSNNPSKRPQMAEILMALGNLARLTGRERPTGLPSLVASTPRIKPERLGRIGQITLTINLDDISGGSTNSRLKFDEMRIRRLTEHSVMKLKRYSIQDIRSITNYPMRKEGLGIVYKGKVSDEIYVAVKLFNKSVRAAEIFINEVATMGMIHHENIVRLLGFCADEFNRALVYEFLSNGSLDKFLFQKDQEHHTLRVQRLQKIAIGIARGIEYLHQGCEQRIIHFDIQPRNILLDGNYNPKICAFGLAKCCRKDINAVSPTTERGTVGYIAPELLYKNFGDVSYKSDIYSFGILLLEMLGIRRNIDLNLQDESELYFLECVINGGRLRIEVEDEGEDRVLKILAIVGFWCIQLNPNDRPSMTLVLQMLEGSGENLLLPPYPFYTHSSFQAMDKPSTSKQDTNQAHQKKQDFWKSLWNMKLPSTVILFIWNACHSIYPTSDQLMINGVLVPRLCGWCKGKDESISHVLLECEMAKRTWRCSTLGFNFDMGRREHFGTWFERWLTQAVNPDDIALSGCIIWTLWTASCHAVRNQKGAVTTPAQLWDQSKKMFKQAKDNWENFSVIWE